MTPALEPMPAQAQVVTPDRAATSQSRAPATLQKQTTKTAAERATTLISIETDSGGLTDAHEDVPAVIDAHDDVADVAIDAPNDGSQTASDQCPVTIDVNKFTAANTGCGGYSTGCKGQIHILNQTGTAWVAPVIKFSVAPGVTCVKTHSSPKWTITDDGSVSHQCVFTGKYPDSNDGGTWAINTGTGFGFGYDTTSLVDDAPTNVTVSAAVCVGLSVHDGGADGGATDSGATDAGATDGGATDGGATDGG